MTDRGPAAGAAQAQNWQASLAVKVAGLVLYLMAVVGFLFALFLLRNLNSRIETEFHDESERFAFRISLLALENPSLGASELKDCIGAMLPEFSLTGVDITAGAREVHVGEKSDEDFTAIRRLPVPSLFGEATPLVQAAMHFPPVDKVAGTRRIVILLLMVGVSLVLGLFLNQLIRRTVVAPVLVIRDAAAAIAAGDLNMRVKVKGKDELAQLGEALNMISESIRKVILHIGAITRGVSDAASRINDTSREILGITGAQEQIIAKTSAAITDMSDSISDNADHVQSLFTSAGETSKASDQMSSSMATVARGTDSFEQASLMAAESVGALVQSIRKVEASIKQLSMSSAEIFSSVSAVQDMVKAVDRKADESVHLAENVSRAVNEKGVSSVAAATTGMKEIKKVVSGLSETINTLGSRSDDIGAILVVIKEVTEQAKLLSLNASILAAAAGVHGRGFSVVASEIAVLAEKTSKSTKEINSVVRTVQEEIASSVTIASDGIGTVDRGLGLVQDVSSSFREILDSSMASTEVAKLIKRATTEQSHAIDEITDSIENMTQHQITDISRAVGDQTKSSETLLEATRKVSGLSKEIRLSISRQSEAGRKVAEASVNVAERIGSIARSTESQKEKSEQIVHSMENAHATTKRLTGMAASLSETIGGVKKEAENLLAEVSLFRTSPQAPPGGADRVDPGSAG